MIEFLMVHYIGLLVFYKELTHLIQKLKSLNETQGTKLDSNWIPIWILIRFSLIFDFIYIYIYIWCVDKSPIDKHNIMSMSLWIILY